MYQTITECIAYCPLGLTPDDIASFFQEVFIAAEAFTDTLEGVHLCGPSVVVSCHSFVIPSACFVPGTASTGLTDNYFIRLS